MITRSYDIIFSVLLRIIIVNTALFLSSCQQEISIKVHFGDMALPISTHHVTLKSFLNGDQLKTVESYAFKKYGYDKLILNPLSIGLLKISAEVLDEDECLLGSGSGELSIPEQPEIHIPLSIKSTKDTYTLTIEGDAGTSFTMNPPLASGECSGGLPCSVSRLCGTKIKVNPSTKDGEYPIWKNDCPSRHGELLCGFSMDRDHELYIQSSSQVCTQEGWCWQNTVPQGLGLRAIWGFSEQDVWVVGEYGTILHWDGKKWENQPSGIYNTLHGIWGSDPTDLWVGSWDGTLLHRSRDVWKIEKQLSDINITALWGDGVNLWVGGWGGIYRRDSNGTWAQEVTGEHISAIWGNGTNDVWAGAAEGRILHKKAREKDWKVVLSPVKNYIQGIWGASNTDIWAITDNSILTYDANKDLWKVEINDEFARFGSIWGSSRFDVWAGGQGRIYHWDGSTWKENHQNQDRVGMLVNGIWGSDKDNAWMVGTSGHILRWDGVQWSSMYARLTYSDLESVWSNGKNDIWTASDNNEIFYWNGRQWLDRSPGNLPRWERIVKANLWGLPAAGIVWYATTIGTLLRWTGSAWDAVQPPPPVLVTDVWGTSDRDLWVTGTDGSTAHFDGKNWTRFVVNTEGPLWKLQGSTTDDVWAMGPDCRLFHWDGNRWLGIRGPCWTGPHRGVYDMYLAARNDLWYVSGAELWRGDGAVWQREDEINRALGAIWGIWGTGTGDVWAISSGLGHWNGTKWSVERPPSTSGAVLAGRPGEEVWLVGKDGMILRKPR